MSNINIAFEKDYDEYIKFTKDRISLSNSPIGTELKHTYELIYIFSNLIFYFSKINTKEKIYHYALEAKGNMIIAFDLLNINYQSASNKELRSTIESVFRCILSIERYLEYRKNSQIHKFKTTPKLKILKSMIDTHKTGKMTKYVQEYFSDKCIKDTINNFYSLYGDLSKDVHADLTSSASPHEYLSNYLIIDTNKSKKGLNTLRDTIIKFLIVFYYYSKFVKEIDLPKSDIVKIEYLSRTDIGSALDTIDTLRV